MHHLVDLLLRRHSAQGRMDTVLDAAQMPAKRPGQLLQAVTATRPRWQARQLVQRRREKLVPLLEHGAQNG